jgi:hypothetical protein
VPTTAARLADEQPWEDEPTRTLCGSPILPAFANGLI